MPEARKKGRKDDGGSGGGRQRKHRLSKELQVVTHTLELQREQKINQ